MPRTATSNQSPISFPVAVRNVFYRGSDVGLGFPVKECSFFVAVNGVWQEWSIAETLARLAEFSSAAQKRILYDCAMQIKFGASWEAS